jgi:nucleoside-diphosphate-sugar epimerase
VAGRTALVTEGAGFIGSDLAESLLDRGQGVYALDDLSTGSEANVFQPAQNSYFHLPVENTLLTNVRATENVLEQR